MLATTERTSEHVIGGNVRWYREMYGVWHQNYRWANAADTKKIMPVTLQ